MIFTKETANQMRTLVKSGTLGFGVFECKDIYATYEELKAKGVEFSKAPEEGVLRNRSIIQRRFRELVFPFTKTMTLFLLTKHWKLEHE